MSSGNPPRDADTRGAVQMTAAMGLFVLNDTLVKFAGGHLPAGQILLLRGVFATAAALAILWHARKPLDWRMLGRPVVGWRIALEFGTALASVVALSQLPVVTVSTVMMTAPIIIVAVTLFSYPAGHAPAQLALCVVGFAGACLVLQPAWVAPSPGWWSALLLAMLLAARDLVTRRIPESISSEQLALVATLAVTCGGALVALLQDWHPVTAGHATALAGAACVTTLGNLLLIRACRGTRLAVVAPYRYTIVLWALLSGLLLWGDRPGPVALMGCALIVIAGLAALWIPRG